MFKAPGCSQMHVAKTFGFPRFNADELEDVADSYVVMDKGKCLRKLRTNSSRKPAFLNSL